MPLPLDPAAADRVITRRSVLLGLAGVVTISAVTPYNDYALNNTFLVGNNLPLGVVMFMFLFVLLVNGPLHRWRPRSAFTSGELAVALGMALVGCAVPSSGLMRYLPGTLVGPFSMAQSNGEYQRLLESMNLPQWIFPVFEGGSARDWVNDPVVNGFMGRWTEDTPPPYLAWLRPAITWGVFVFALYAALLCIATIVRRQWNENERLAFPLAQIHLALIEQPAPGRALNGYLGRRSFWVSFAVVFFVHAWNGCRNYFPQYFPEIPVWYNLSGLFTEPPWTYVDFKLKDAAVFFTVVGVTYFLPSYIAFSLWFFFILNQGTRVVLGSTTGDPTVHGQADQHFGAVLAFALTILWIGRSQWRLVLGQAFRGEREGEPRGRYLPYRFAFWTLIGSALVMVLWLWLAGCTLGGAAVLVLLLLLLFLVITRIIAEAGLVHGQLEVPLYKPWQFLAAAGGKPVPLETFFVGGMLQSMQHDFREVLPVYASHGLKVADGAVFGGRAMEEDTAAERRTGRRLVGLFALTLLVGYAISFASMIGTEYHYAWTKDESHRMPINDWGVRDNLTRHLMAPSLEYEKQAYHPKHSPAAHVSLGFGVAALLAFLRLRFAWWPLHPIGYLMVDTFPGNHLWFSIMLGWLAKTLIVRFGGAKLFVDGKPFFLGLIVGESAAAGFWLLMGILLSAAGVPYRPVNIMPG